MDISSEKNGLQSVWVWTDFIVSMGMGKRSNGCVGAAKKGLHVVWMWTDFIVATGMEKRSNGCVDVAKKGLQVVWMWTAALLSLVAFFLVCEDFGRMFDSSFPACAFFFFFKVEISSCTL